MKTRALMIPNPITIGKAASIQEAIETMKANSIRHLPVVTKSKRLVGFVTLADLKQGLIPSMLGDVTLNDLMIRSPITVGPDDDIEIAAQLIYKYKIGGMPVVEGDRVVGIITETDILRAFIDMMGILTASSRIDVVVGDNSGEFQRAMQVITENGGEIINVGMTTRPARKRLCYFRLAPCDVREIRQALEAKGFEVVHAMG